MVLVMVNFTGMMARNKVSSGCVCILHATNRQGHIWR